jgi:hypothetical protein
MIEQERTVQPALERWGQIALVVGVVALIVSAIGLILNPAQFFHSYLVAFLYWFGFCVACTGMIMIHYLGGGRWGAAIGDVLRSGVALWPVVAIMFIPVVLGVTFIYPWTDPAIVAADPLLRQKAGWLSIPAWLIRAVIYFIAFVLLSRYLNRWFAEWDATGDPVPRRRLRNLSGGGMVLLILGVSFAMFDWVMSLEPDWTSTIYGLMYTIGHALSGWAFAIFVLARLRHRWPVSEYNSWQLWRDLGSLMLAMVILWTYTSFDQFMLIWVANLSDEIPWYLNRITGGWEYLAILMIFTQFVIPFGLLVLRGTRKSAANLTIVTMVVFLGRFLEEIWLVQPDLRPSPFINHWTDLTLWLGLGGIWLTLFLRQLRGRLVGVRPWGIFPSHVPATTAHGPSLGTET